MTSAQLQFSLLGPLDVRVAGRPLAIGGTKPRMLLATLLLHANRVVTTDLLIEVLWPQQPPRSAAANLRTYVSSLRTGPGQVGARIRAQRSGYAIDVEPGELDMLAFEDLVLRARQDRADGRPHEALDQMQQALALWRGSPLEDLPGSRVWDGRLETLAETRLTVAEELLALRVRLGQHSTAITELRGLLVEHPFQEGLWRQLMLALHRSGRQAEALDAYTEVRRRLVSELGIEPSVELRRIHAAILAGESPDVQDWETTTAPPRVGPPQQLPADTPDFTGRAEDVRALVAVLSVADRPLTDPPAIAVVVGPPGVGKSTLAVHTAHALRGDFPDGQLYLDLAGTSENPQDPADLLAEVLRTLGVSGAALPDSVHERAALFRSLLAERRMLVLLDDAASLAQVRPLLPASCCAVLITSRRRITELPGAHQVELDVLPAEDALRLLGRIATPERVNQEPESAMAILRSCGHLPLAIRIACLLYT